MLQHLGQTKKVLGGAKRWEPRTTPSAAWVPAPNTLDETAGDPADNCLLYCGPGQVKSWVGTHIKAQNGMTTTSAQGVGKPAGATKQLQINLASLPAPTLPQGFLQSPP